MLQLPVSGKETMAELADLVRRVPAYRLNSGTQMQAIADSVERLLASGRAQ
jgi:hypothetical protein